MSYPIKKWCIYGSGRAGQARQRTASSVQPSIQTQLFSARAIELSAVLSTEHFDGVVICTENQRHADDIRCALQHNCHVIVEFPLALSHNEALELYELAESQNRHIHCEHIGLLKPSFQWLKTQSAQIAQINVSFSGNLYRWVESSYRDANVATLTIGRLQVLWGLCGPLNLTATHYIDHGDGYTLTTRFEGANQSQITLQEVRRPQTQRKSVWRFLDAQQQLITPPVQPPMGLFHADWSAALAYFQGAPSYLPQQEVLSVLELCDQINEQAC